MKHIVASNLRMMLVAGLVGLALGAILCLASGNAEDLPILILMALVLDVVSLGLMITIDYKVAASVVKEVQEAEKKEYGGDCTLYSFERMAFLIHVLRVQPAAIIRNKDELLFYLHGVLSDEDFERFNHV